MTGASGTPGRQWQDVAVPRTLPGVGPVFSRRRVLAGGAALAVLGMTAPACSSPPAPPGVDELESQLTRAQHDSELATAAAAAATDKPISTALTEVASERARHAQALTAEIARLAVNPTTSASSQTSGPTSTTSAPAAPAPTLSDVINSLRESAASASHLATTSSGYRAGLLGSIAAACTASYSVALVFGGSAS
jgi:hypothetical protein